jgi:hypothetical protein
MRCCLMKMDKFCYFGVRSSEGKIECGPLPFLAFGPDPAAMSLDDPGDRRQADTETFDLMVALKSLKGSKKPS